MRDGIDNMIKKMKRSLSLSVIVILLSPMIYFTIDIVLADSNTYYVANNGSDLNDGISPSTPWKTITKVNTALNDGTIKTGDDIYFKRGNTFLDGGLVIKVGGSSTNQMIIGAYGTGTKPVFDGSGHGYNILLTIANVNHVRIENLILDHSTNSVCIYNNHTNISIMDISINEALHNAMFINETIGVRIENLTVTDPGFGGVVLYGGKYERLGNVTLKNAHIYHTHDGTFHESDGVTIHSSDGTGYHVGKNFYLENVTCHGFGEQGFDITSGENIIIKNCEAYGNNDSSVLIGHGVKNVTFINFYSHDEISTSRNYGFIMDNCSHVIVRNSKIFNVRYHYFGIGDSEAKGPDNVTILHNDIVFDENTVDNTIIQVVVATTLDIIFKNNIILSQNNSVPTRFLRYLSGRNVTNTNSNWSHNIWYRGDNATTANAWNNGVANLNWNQWSAQMQSYQELKQDPKITNPGSDWTLESDSPCIDAGDWLTYTDGAGSGTAVTVDNARYFCDGYGLTDGDIIQIGTNKKLMVTDVNYDTDRITVNRSFTWIDNDPVSFAYYGSQPDIGAFEYVSTEPDILPKISQIIYTTSNPLDTDPIFGWINISCAVTDDVAVDTVQLHIKNPNEIWNNITMNQRDTSHFYYQSNNAFSQPGNYSYIIKAVDINNNVNFSDSNELIMPTNWDINCDSECSILDLVMVSNHYGEESQLGWIREDTNNDGKINVNDMVFVSNYYE